MVNVLSYAKRVNVWAGEVRFERTERDVRSRLPGYRPGSPVILQRLRLRLKRVERLGLEPSLADFESATSPSMLALRLRALTIKL